MFAACMDVARRVGLALMDGKTGGQYWTVSKLRWATCWCMAAAAQQLGISACTVVPRQATSARTCSTSRSIGINIKQLYGRRKPRGVRLPAADHEARADTVGAPRGGGDQGGRQRRDPGQVARVCSRNTTGECRSHREVLGEDETLTTPPATPAFSDAHGHLKIIDRVRTSGRIKGSVNDGAMFAPNM